jgi:AraC-like DNA-binding protein
MAPDGPLRLHRNKVPLNNDWLSMSDRKPRMFTPGDTFLTTGDMPTFRSAALRGLRAIIAELGGDAEAYAKAADVPVSALDHDDVPISADAGGRLLQIAATEMDCPDLGLRLAARQDISVAGPLALAMQSAPTLADALDCASRYLATHSEVSTLESRDDPYGARGVVSLEFNMKPGVAQSELGTDIALAMLHRAIESLVGRYGLRSVELPYQPLAPLSAYEEFFRAPVRVNRPVAALRVPSTIGALPIDGGEGGVHQLAVAYLTGRGNGDGSSVTARVSAAVRLSLGPTPPHIVQIARTLALHPRTLQRQLAAENSSFSAILDDARRHEAGRLLLTTDVPISQVAQSIGLSGPTALTRCSRRWWDATPSAVRKKGLPTENS